MFCTTLTTPSLRDFLRSKWVNVSLQKQNRTRQTTPTRRKRDDNGNIDEARSGKAREYGVKMAGREGRQWVRSNVSAILIALVTADWAADLAGTDISCFSALRSTAVDEFPICVLSDYDWLIIAAFTLHRNVSIRIPCI